MDVSIDGRVGDELADAVEMDEESAEGVGKGVILAFSAPGT